MTRDHVYINGLRVMVLIGVLPHERLAPQPIQIDVDVEVDLSRAGRTDALEDTVNYGAMCDAVAALARASEDLLLERLAHRVAECVLGFDLVQTAHVTITKLNPPIDEELVSTAVRITRTHNDFDIEQSGSNANKVEHTVVVAMGSNLGNRAQNLAFGISQMGSVIAQSQVFETDPVGGPDNQGPYLNMVAVVSTTLDPYAFLRRLHVIEADALRERGVHWGPRTLDLDIIFYDEVRIEDERLAVPHPRWTGRRFVLAPLAELMPERCPADWQQTAPPGAVYPRGALSQLL